VQVLTVEALEKERTMRHQFSYFDGVIAGAFLALLAVRAGDCYFKKNCSKLCVNDKCITTCPATVTVDE